MVDKLFWVTAFVVSVCLCVILFARVYTSGYKQGQIDAMTGTIYYELITYPDSTREWGKIGD